MRARWAPRPSSPRRGSSASIATRFLQEVSTTPDEWFQPSDAMIDRHAGYDAESYAFDHWGRDTRDPAAMEYCTNLRLAWVYQGQALRVDVRIWYLRHGPASFGADLVGCAAAPATIDGRGNDVRIVHASTVLRWTPDATLGTF
jgi:hypothetical protein